MSLFRLFLITLLCFFHRIGEAQLYTFQSYNHRDGLLMETTLSCAQDAEGYLWIGTDGAGMMRFDGRKFFEVGPAGKSHQYHVSAIYPASGGMTYFTSLYDGILSYYRGKFTIIYKPRSDEGDCQYLSMIDSSFVLVTQRSIGIVSKSGTVMCRFKPKAGTTINVRQILKIPQGVLIFTSEGNFIVRSNRIIPLSTWHRKVQYAGFNPYFATFSRNKLTLYDSVVARQLELILTNDGIVFSGKPGTCSQPPLSSEWPVKFVTERQGMAFLLTEDNMLYRLGDGKLKHMVRNYSGSLEGIHGMYIDRNNDLWMNTAYGLFKVSCEPFTKVDLDPIYHDKSISVIHRTQSGILILSNMKGELKIGYMYDGKLAQYALRAFQVSESPRGTFIATDRGLMELKGTKLVSAAFPFQKGKSISMLHWDGTFIWYSPKGEGLVRYHPATGQTKRFQHTDSRFPHHYYTAQNNFDRSAIYFGSNNGIYVYTKANDKLTYLEGCSGLGSYCGNSTTDRYGTCWFTLDKGLIGITLDGEIVTIEDDKVLPSTLFYTLTSDTYGNLLAGTNKGINVIRVDRSGHVVRHKNYSSKEGFGGYETHMRSQFQSGNYSYVGTIEGLYLINTEVLRNYPPPPVPIIHYGRENENGELIADQKPYFTFKCLLPKSNAIMYSYRLVGERNKWSDFSFDNKIYLPELDNGEYTLEVRASYDGMNVSSTARHPISVRIPIWRTKWFLVLIVVLLGIINIAYLEWSKSYVSSNIFNTKDVTVDVRIMPRMILFGLIVNAIMLVIADGVEDKIFDTARLNIIFSGILFILYMIGRHNVREISNTSTAMTIFYMAYGCIILEDFILIYQTNIHPFPLFSITMSTSLLPFIASRIRWVITISLIQLFIAAAMLIWIDNALYNEILFISAITISGGLAVMVTYLRNDSLEKLIFVSGVINKGNVMVISFNQKGIITYCSENITEYFALDFASVTGKPLLVLNPLVVTSEMREINLRTEFEDGKVLLVPMRGKNGAIVWMEWSCKYFNESVRVLMGQDITEKLTIATNYESLVENAQDMIYKIDVNGTLKFANERCVQLFGYRNESLIGKNCLAFVPPEHRERVQQFYVDQFKNKIHNTYLEFPIRSKAGRIFWVGQNVSTLYEPGSRRRISGFIALARDITEKRANDLLIEQQNKNITASINYAKRIQLNLLPDKSMLQRHFDESFVLFRPKDIVSGDFYWVEEIGDKLLVVLADCTGHGVPGAFMTLLGINLLNQIVRERKITEPELILNQLNAELAAILPRGDSTSIFDGMDALVAVFSKNQLCYASSGVSFIHNKVGELILHRPDKHITHAQDMATGYTQECITVSRKDSFFLFTDGYQQQFGSVRNKKFSYRRMLELLEKVHMESMPLQKKYFENALRNWAEGHEQTDDITVMGLRAWRGPTNGK